MDLVNELSNVLIMLIRAGTIFRVVYCCIRIVITDEETNVYRKRIKNVILGYILAEIIFQLKDIVINYYT